MSSVDVGIVDDCGRRKLKEPTPGWLLNLRPCGTSRSGPGTRGVCQQRRVPSHGVNRDADIWALFHVRTRTRENTYTLAELQALGITPDSVTDKLARTYEGWVCTDDDVVVAFYLHRPGHRPRRGVLGELEVSDVTH